MSTITVRIDAEVERALHTLMQEADADKSAVIRDLILRACRSRAEDRLRAEAEALAADEADRAAIREVQEDMAPLRAW